MGQIFMTAINAVFPIVALIMIGYFLRKKEFITENFVKTGSKFVFQICLPAMLFTNVYEISGMEAIRWDLVIYCVAAIVVLFALGLLAAMLTTNDAKRRGVLWQVVYRSNFAIVGIPLAASLGGTEAVAATAVTITFVIPVYNIFSVIALSVFSGQSDNGKTDVKAIAKDIVTNPLTVSVLIGLLCLILRTVQQQIFGEVVFALNVQTQFLYKVISNLSSIASPFALVVLGGQCEFAAVKGMKKELIVGTLSRIVAAPLLVIGVAVLLTKFTNVISFGANEMPALISLFGSPTAVSGAVMAAEMNNDEQLATQLVVWTSAGSILTIFVTVCWLMSMGFLQT